MDAADLAVYLGGVASDGGDLEGACMELLQSGSYNGPEASLLQTVLEDLWTGGKLHQELAARLCGEDPQDKLPMKCCTCGQWCKDRAESYVHTEATGHQRFLGGGNGRDDRTLQPLVCTACGHHCANRAESWEHTEATGHTRFGGTGAAESQVCRDSLLALQLSLEEVAQHNQHHGIQEESAQEVDMGDEDEGARAACSLASNQEASWVQEQLEMAWSKDQGSVPRARAVYAIQASNVVQGDYRRNCQIIGHVPQPDSAISPGNQQHRFHGTRQTCAFSGQPCRSAGCAACGIIRAGFKIRYNSSNTGHPGFFGIGHYTTSKLSTARGYGNVLIVTHVAVGITDVVQDPTTEPLPHGCHSRMVMKQSGNDELMVPNDAQLLPLYLVLFD